jgi:hypothetical protein
MKYIKFFSLMLAFFAVTNVYSVPFYRLWGTYYGANSVDIARKSAIDSEGNIYITGQTRSSSLATSGAWQEIKNSDYDVFLAKFNSSGVRIWCTYLGGSGADNAEGIAIDNENNIYITGSTISPEAVFNYNGWQSQKNISNDAFLTKFNPNGLVIWSTYCGGNGSDLANSICIDNQNNVYIAGTTNSNDTMGINGFKTSLTGSGDGFIAKYNSSGNKLWSTYFGGNNIEDIRGIKIDQSNNLYIAGFTSSTASLSLNSIYSTYNGGYYDSFVAKLENNGQVLWSAYFGGSDWDCAYSLNLDTENNIIIAGWTKSSANIASNGFQNTKSELSDGFIAKYSNSGILMWSSYYGGNNDDYIWSLALDNNNNIFAVGTTQSTGSIAYGDSEQSQKADSNDAFIAKISADGQMIWSTYYGGNGLDEAKNICISNSDIVICGSTESTNIFGTDGWQEQKSAASDAFILKLTETQPYASIDINELNTNYICSGDSVNISFTVNKDLLENNHFIIQLSDSIGLFGSGTNIDTISSLTSVTNHTTKIPKGIPPSQYYKIRVISTNPILKSSPTIAKLSIDNGNKKLSFKSAFFGLWTGTNSKFVPTIVELRLGNSLMTSVLYKRIFTGFDDNGNLSMNLDSIPNNFYWIIFRTAGFYPLAIPYKVELPHCGTLHHDFTESASNAVGGAMTMINYNQSGFYVVRSGDLNMDLRVNSTDTNLLLKPSLGTNVRTLIPEK